MNLKTILFGAASALVLSAGAANAVPATAETSLHVRSGPGTEYEVVGTIPAGGAVDVGGCTGSWCRVSFSGGTGFASRSYLAMAGGPAVGVAVAPGYAYADEPYYDDYYDYGYGYGPSVGVFVGGTRGRFHHRWNRGWNGGRVGTWTGGHRWNGNRVGGNTTWNGNRWNGNRVGSAQGGRSFQGGRQGFAGPPASWQRPGTGIGAAGGSRGGMAGASAGMRSGGGAVGGGAHVGGGAQGGFAGSIARH